MPFTVNARNKLLDNVFKGVRWSGAGSPFADIGRLTIHLSSTPINEDGSGFTGVGTQVQTFNNGGAWATPVDGITNLNTSYTLTTGALTAAAVAVRSNTGGPVIYYYNFPVARVNYAGETIRAHTNFRLKIE